MIADAEEGPGLEPQGSPWFFVGLTPTLIPKTSVRARRGVTSERAAMQPVAWWLATQGYSLTTVSSGWMWGAQEIAGEGYVAFWSAEKN